LKPVKLSQIVLDAIAGHYKFGSDFFIPDYTVTLFEKDGNLYLRGSRMSDALLIPLSESEFFHRGFWTKIIFDKNEKGEIVDMYYDYYPDYKAKKLIEK